MRRSTSWPRGSSDQPGAACKQAAPSLTLDGSSGPQLAPPRSWEQGARSIQAGPGIAVTRGGAGSGSRSDRVSSRPASHGQSGT